jgi:DNA-binding IclR family transcriptional regulator
MVQDGTQDGPRTVEAADKTCRIIGVLHRTGGAGVTEIADRLDVTKGTIHTHLTTLRQNGFVVKSGDVYRTSFRFLKIGEDLRARSKLYRFGLEGISDLADQTDTRTRLAVEGYGLAVVLAVCGSHPTMTLTGVGGRDHVHCIASGKAILANIPRDRVEDIVAKHGLPERTPNTITDTDALFDELQEVRDRGYAYNDEENIEGLRAVGTAIKDVNGAVIGSISASGPASTMKGERFREEMPNEIMNLKNNIELSIRVEDSDVEEVDFESI